MPSYQNSSLRRRRAAASALFALLVLWLGLAAATRAQDVAAMPSPWIVVESQGPAEIRHDRGNWLPLMSGVVVAAASEIRTGRPPRSC